MISTDFCRFPLIFADFFLLKPRRRQWRAGDCNGGDCGGGSGRGSGGGGGVGGVGRFGGVGVFGRGSKAGGVRAGSPGLEARGWKPRAGGVT